jgi:hypothetical protein
MKRIELTDAEAILLVKLLDECQDYRSDMGCNDPNKDEEELFTKKLRKDMQRFIGDMSEEDIEDLNGSMSNWEYPVYMKKLIKKQIK